MSESRKKSRGWIISAALALLVLYPLSMGPVVKLTIAHDWGPRFIFRGYWPLLQIANRFDAPGEIMARYVSFWGESVSGTEYFPGQGIGFRYLGETSKQFWSAYPELYEPTE